MKRAIPIALALALVACSTENEVSAPDAEQAAATADGGCEATVEFTGTRNEELAIISCDEEGNSLTQKGYTLFPGATVNSTTTIQGDGRDGVMMMISSDAPLADLVAHYRAQGEAQGIQFQNEVVNDNFASLMGMNPDGNTLFLNGAREGNQSEVGITFGQVLSDAQLPGQ